MGSYLTLHWNLQSSNPNPCFTHYIIMITSATDAADSVNYTVIPPDRSLTLPIPSLNDTEYTFTITAVDAAGRYGHFPYQNRPYISDGM